MTMENQPFPIENGDGTPVSHVGRELGHVYPLKNAGCEDDSCPFINGFP